MRRPLFFPGLLLVLGTACPEAGPARFTLADLGRDVSLICPGNPDGRCDYGGDPELRVGAAKRSISPQGWEAWEDVDGDSEYRAGLDVFFDCGLDRICPEDPGWPGADEGEGNGRFDAVWLAGFQNSRPASGIHDDVWARATWLQQGETSVGVVALDVVGFFYDEVETVRAEARASLGLDHVIVVSTHTHEGPDTMGIWGPNIVRSGVNPDHMAFIHARIQEALADAAAAAVPAELHVGAYRIPDAAWGGSGVNNVNIDTRDPAIVDPTVRTARFTAAADGSTIATWVNFANHPEAAADENNLVSSDFAHALRETVEGGAMTGPDGALAGLGGVALYLQGAVGGMQTPLRCSTVDLDGTVHDRAGLDKAMAVGRVIGYHALQAVRDERPAVEPALHVRTRALFAPVQNVGYQYMFGLGVFDREAYNYDPGSLIDDWNQPDVRTEVSVLELGPLGVATVPGELLPELYLGGYDGASTGPLQELVDPSNEHPPDLARAPAGPYLIDRMPGEVRMLFGLANDELGYIIPDYDYVLDERDPYLDEAPGDHYEETNSLGPDARAAIVGALEELLGWTLPEPTPVD